MNVLMTGPGKGHNAVRFLKWFNERPEQYSFSYYHYNSGSHYDLESFTSVSVVGTYNFAALIGAIRKADLIWVHNWTPWPVLLLILLFRSRRAVLNFNFWSEKLPLEILSGSGIKSWFYRKFFDDCTCLQSSWFSVKKHVDKFSHSKSVLLRWGFEEEYFEEVTKADLSEFTLEFTKQLPAGKVKFFTPKSIGFPNRQDLVVEAAAMLRDSGYSNFVIYLWQGNRVESEIAANLLSRIEELQLRDMVNIVNHPFLTNKEMKFIWKRMDCGLQFCDQDQLTSAFTEPQLFEVDILASNIYSYSKYNEYYEVSVPLAENDSESVFSLMRQYLDGKLWVSNSERQARKSTIAKYYRFNKNMPQLMTYFQSLQP